MPGDGARVVSRGDEDVPLPEAETPSPAALYSSTSSPSRWRRSSVCRGSGFAAVESRQMFPTDVIVFARSDVRPGGGAAGAGVRLVGVRRVR